MSNYKKKSAADHSDKRCGVYYFSFNVFFLQIHYIALTFVLKLKISIYYRANCANKHKNIYQIINEIDKWL